MTTFNIKLIPEELRVNKKISQEENRQVDLEGVFAVRVTH
jgi:hypothetical protein